MNKAIDRIRIPDQLLCYCLDSTLSGLQISVDPHLDFQILPVLNPILSSARPRLQAISR